MEVFCQVLFVIWQDFVIVWQNTPCTVCNPAMACFPHWCCGTVLPDGVIQQNILQKWCHFTCLLCAWASEGIFQEDHWWIFPNVFLGGTKNGEICFLPLET